MIRQGMMQGGIKVKTRADLEAADPYGEREAKAMSVVAWRHSQRGDGCPRLKHTSLYNQIHFKTAAIDHGGNTLVYNPKPVGVPSESPRPLHRSSPHFFGFGPFFDTFGIGALGVGVLGVGVLVSVLFACRMGVC